MAWDSQSPSAAGLKTSRKGANDGSGLAEWVMLLVRLRRGASDETEGGRADNTPGSPMYPGLSLIRLEALASVMGGAGGWDLKRKDTYHPGLKGLTVQLARQAPKQTS